MNEYEREEAERAGFDQLKVAVRKRDARLGSRVDRVPHTVIGGPGEVSVEVGMG